MILQRQAWIPIFILFLLFTSMFVSLVSIFDMPNKIMGGNGVYVLTSSTDKNPIRSNLDIKIAYGLENMSYIQKVSPEIFVFSVINGKGITIRGVKFRDFMDIENGKIIEGKIPSSPDGAMVGINAKKRLNVNVGDKLTLLGSFSSSIAIVNITGIYKTGETSDDEVLVSIPTGEKLAGIREGTVSIIRVKTDNKEKINEMMDPNYPKFKMEINSTAQVYANSQLNFSVKIENIGKNGGNCDLTLKFQNTTIQRRLYVDKERILNFSIPVMYSGNYNLTGVVKNDVFYYTCYTEISVLLKPVFFKGSSFAFTNTTMKYEFTTLNKEKIENATLLVVSENYTKEYKFNGSVDVVYPEIGNYTLTLIKNGFVRKEINISAYQKINISEIGSIDPQPINGSIFLNNTMNVKIYSFGKVYFRIDNGTIHQGNVINMTKKMKENHTLSVNIVWKEYMAMQNYTIHIVDNFTPSVIPSAQNNSPVMYGENLSFEIYDPVPIRNLTVILNHRKYFYPINQSFNISIENYTYNFGIRINELNIDIGLIFFDAWNRSVVKNLHYNVVVLRDVIKPEIYAENVSIWGGNKTEVIARDNVAVANMSVYVDWPYQKYFNSTENNKLSLDVWIPTSFINGGNVTFVKEGTYQARVRVYDTSGNRNETNFTITVNNGVIRSRVDSGVIKYATEKNPPIILGDKIVNLTSGNTLYKAFDNVNVMWIGIYENTQLIKFVNRTANPLIIYLNSTDLPDGLHHLKIYAKDVNNNIGYIDVVAIKNYTDREKPDIYVNNNTITNGTKITLWSGEKIYISGSDNVALDHMVVHVDWPYPEKYFNKTPIETVFINDTSVTFVKEGEYNATVTAYDVSGNVNQTHFVISINNTNERDSPRFLSKQIEMYNASDTVKIKSFDNVGIDRIWVMEGNKTIGENNSNEITFSAKLLSLGITTVKVYAQDINGNVGNTTYQYLIMDNIPPEIVTENITIWGGNKTKIIGGDNFRVAGMSVQIFGHYFNSTTNETTIDTEFTYKNYTEFVSEGEYIAKIKIWDPNGNVNYTNVIIIINNTGEKIPPVIMGDEYSVISLNSSSSLYYSYDNVKVWRMWYVDNGTVIREFEGDKLWVNYSDLSAGYHNITIYSEDINGNTASMNIMVNVVGVEEVTVNTHLEKNVITDRDRGKIILDITNGAIPGYYNLTVYLDGLVYYSEEIYLEPHERTNLYLTLPYLDTGKHTINVENQTLTLNVEKEVIEKLPTDLVLKYSKGLKFSESKGVIYKGFQLSEGNFYLVFSSLLVVTMLLIFLGIYSTTLKGLKNDNVGILRAIGASNNQIFKFLMRDVLKYMIPSMVGGIIGGYFMVIAINNLGILTAFGHKLIISPNIYNISIVTALSFIFIILSFVIIFRSIFTKHVVHLMGREENRKIVKFEDLIH